MEVNEDSWKEWVSEYIENPNAYGSDALYAYLRHGYKFRATSVDRIMQILILPSFEPAVSYEIFRTRVIKSIDEPITSESIANKFDVVKTTWHSDTDMQLRADNPSDYKPTFTYSKAEVSLNDMETMFNQFKLSIPMWFHPTVEDDYMGLDGTNYELALGGFFLGVRYRLWSMGPTEWKPIYDATSNATTLLENILTKD
ncbi:MAG: hypothetical protein Phog2KO_39390 [Phototrophicaceae bacterium]